MSNTAHIEQPPLPDGLQEIGGEDITFELGHDRIWRAYDEYGLIAVAGTFREIYERTALRAKSEPHK